MNAKKPRGALKMFGTIGPPTATKTAMGMQWRVDVTVDLIPGSGEQVFGAPTADVLNSSGTVLVTITLTKGTGDSYTGSGTVNQVPASVTISCRFVSDFVKRSQPIP